MAESAESALRFCQGRTRAEVDTDDMLRFALTRAVEIVGEAANRVSIESDRKINRAAARPPERKRAQARVQATANTRISCLMFILLPPAWESREFLVCFLVCLLTN